ncbi:MAG: hypothetical protein IJX25_03915 [Clostridia bacterium]|nr:hypothetical protein [Clostridia bacterium]
MNSKKYVLHHDFGYGRVPEIEDVIKLDLRNIDDLKVYLGDILQKDFLARVKNYEVHFSDGCKTKILIEQILKEGVLFFLFKKILCNFVIYDIILV